jgi:hypothetical protein
VTRLDSRGATKNAGAGDLGEQVQEPFAIRFRPFSDRIMEMLMIQRRAYTDADKRLTAITIKIPI